MEKNQSHIQSVVRALQILELLSEGNSEKSLTEIAEEMGWPKSTVHGVITTLRDYRFVDQSEQNGRYRIGIRFFEFGHRFARNWDIREIAIPVMKKLTNQFGEMVQLATEDAGEVLYIEKVESTHLIRIVSEIGTRLPMHCSGLGKALLAFKPPSELKRILSQKGMPRMTVNTITDPEKLEKELAKVRKQGYAVDNREIMEGLRCIAAPIRDKNGGVQYAISVSGMAERLSGEYFEQVKGAVVEAAEEISNLMGYRETLS